MGQAWDTATWRAPGVLAGGPGVQAGSVGLVFGGTRTWHRLAVALEDAGFEIRDTLMWLYGRGSRSRTTCPRRSTATSVRSLA